MSSTDDLKTHAASNHDFYALLNIPQAASESEIRRAYRRTALKYHPDKIANPTPADIDKFHLLQIANDVLSDPSVRQLYDNAREARERKKREHDMMDAAKRKMKEDLEARERAGAATTTGGAQRGMKRTWAAAGVDDDAEEKLQREIDRIAQDGQRRRREAEERLKQQVAEDERRVREEEEEAQRAADKSSQKVDRSQAGGGENVPEQERAVKVRWIREGRGVDIDKDRLASLFAPFGKIESILILKDRRQRLGDKKEKKTVAAGLVVFASIVSAHAAVVDSEKVRRQSAGQDGSDWSLIDSVFWATGCQPDLGTESDTPSASPLSSQGTAPPGKEQTTSAAPPKPTFSFAGLKAAPGAGGNPGKAPSFNSFSSSASKSTSKDSSNGVSTPSMQETTLMRLKNAQREKERKALEEKLRKEDEAADVAEGAANT